MGLGRRKIGIEDASAWVFNRMADVYDARPAYPAALIEALAELADRGERRIVDLGAGIGHLALPLGARGFDVTAVEPALAMLERLRQSAHERGLVLHTLHATAESLPLASGHYQLAIIADALHFLDAERTALEVARVLSAKGSLALVTCELADTPFMRGVVQSMVEAAPRRPRDLGRAITQVSAVAAVPFTLDLTFHDETEVDPSTLERILRSISFIGPAMNTERFEAFRERIHALPGERVWARTFRLRAGQKRG